MLNLTHMTASAVLICALSACTASTGNVETNSKTFEPAVTGRRIFPQCFC